MSYSYTFEETFTITDAKHIAARVATDLKRIQRFYGSPNDLQISSYEVELIAILKAGYLKDITYGFKRNGSWIEPTLRYTARELSGSNANDDDPGRVRPNADVIGGLFSTFLNLNEAWEKLSEKERIEFEKTLPFQRTGSAEPGINGYLSNDKTYSSGGRALDRSSLKSY